MRANKNRFFWKPDGTTLNAGFWQLKEAIFYYIKGENNMVVNQGKFWPTEKDKMPRTREFSIGDETGVTTFDISEIPRETEARLRDDFVLYRAARTCEMLVKGVVGLDEV